MKISHQSVVETTVFYYSVILGRKRFKRDFVYAYPLMKEYMFHYEDKYIHKYEEPFWEGFTMFMKDVEKDGNYMEYLCKEVKYDD